MATWRLSKGRGEKKEGIYTNSMMQKDRVGLCRQFIAEVATASADCPAGCTHKDDAKECRKFMWTVSHKDGFDITLWQDSQLIIAYGIFSSGTRAGLLARGAHGDKESFRVWVPESIQHYNIEGRSATDGGDQLRRKLATAERRIDAQGIKVLALSLTLPLPMQLSCGAWFRLTPHPHRSSRTISPRCACTLQYFWLPPLACLAHEQSSQTHYHACMPASSQPKC